MWCPQLETVRRMGYLSPYDRQYDIVLRRLTVKSEDSFFGIRGSEYEVDNDVPLFACRFAERSEYRDVVAVADENGLVAVRNTSASADGSACSVRCHENAVFDVCWMPNDMKFLTVSGDHSSKLWDMNDGEVREVSAFFGHLKSVKTAVFRRSDPNVFATGARDGKILIWDLRASREDRLRPESEIWDCHAFNAPSAKRKSTPSGGRANSITGLVFRDADALISCGAGDGSIKVWDLRKTYSAHKKVPLPKHSIPYCGSSSKKGYTDLSLDDAGIRLYANCMDDVIYCFNVSAYGVVPERRYTGHENHTYYIKSGLSADSAYLVSGSSDARAYVWNVKYSEPIISLRGHEAEVTCASWCRSDELKIVTCGDDSRYDVWRIGKEFPDQQDRIDLRGEAEEAVAVEKQMKSPWGILEKTPRTRRNRTEYGSSCGKSDASTPTGSDYYSGASLPRRTSKRSLFSMVNGGLDDIKETVETEDSENSKMLKRDRKENDMNGINLPSTSKCDIAYENLSCRTPEKTAKTSFGVYDSPTADLPNFVLNGEAPHRRLMSPLKSPANRIDWLTKIRQRKLSSSEGNPVASPTRNGDPDFSADKTRTSNSKRNQDGTPKSRTPRRRKNEVTLLDYFSPSMSKR